MSPRRLRLGAVGVGWPAARLWISEMGYPSDQFFQWDPDYVGINPPTARFQQAGYLHAAIRVLLHSGARRVFVTLRDLDGQWGIFTSEGLPTGPSRR